ncbi:glycoside hydrolase family 2 protein, partial [Paenibacillus riograndensis]
MIRESFNQGWMVGPVAGFFNMNSNEQPKAVTLPHDAMIAKKRSAQAVSGSKKGYFSDGAYDYVKKFYVPEEYKDKRVTFEFEGVYMHAMVYINGDFAGQHPFGYTNFYIKADRFLKYGAENEIKVVAKSHDDSRWYTGTGIYRNTKIMVADLVHIAVDGVKINATDIESKHAVVVVATDVENEGINPRTVRIVTEIVDADGNSVASDTAPFTAFAGEKATSRQRLYIREPKLWNVETPYLYTCISKVMDGEHVLDEETHTFGIRTLSLDAEDGLRINGEVVKLRGACIHHDNGVIGASTIERADERRIEILKQAGFNAIRSAHHPASKALLKACDRIGMLVMDESFDIWTHHKSDYDYALHFPTWWEQDIQAMVDKDYNHPSVILYSIGNEIPETGSANGTAWGRKIAEKIRSLDSTRYVMNSINGMVAVMNHLQEMFQGNNNSSDTGTDVNSFMANLSSFTKGIMGMDVVTHSTAE